MPEFFYQIKGKQDGEEYSAFGRWIWPPIFSGKIEAPDRAAAKALLEEEYGRTFPTRVLEKDLASNEFLLSIKEIKANDHYTRRLFEVQTCGYCNCQFTVIEKYTINEPGGGFEFCSSECARLKRAESDFTFGNETWRDSPPVIYRITNKATGQCYIGKTRQAFTLRWYQHFFQAKDTKFHKAIKKTPITEWTFEVIEIVAVSELPIAAVDAYLTEREAYHIAAHQSSVTGYNTQGPAEINGDLFNQEDPHAEEGTPAADHADQPRPPGQV